MSSYTKNQYPNLPVYDQFPVVSIPYRSTLKYCEWLNSIEDGQSRKFRLPTESEFTTLMKSLDISILYGNSKDHNYSNCNLN